MKIVLAVSLLVASSLAMSSGGYGKGSAFFSDSELAAAEEFAHRKYNPHDIHDLKTTGLTNVLYCDHIGKPKSGLDTAVVLNYYIVVLLNFCVV